nr:helix-turn-helix domain-containing protein [Actinomycetota bacterium]
VACLWSRTASARVEQRIVPDACVDVLWHRETGALFVAGPDTGPHLTTTEPGTLVGLRFATGATALGPPAHTLRDHRIDLADLWSERAARSLAHRLAETPDTTSAQRLLLDAFPAALSPRVAMIRRLATGRVRDIADTLGLGERQLHRECLRAFGYGPKTLHRVVRFTEALRLARSGTAFAEVAHLSGYADQPHLARDVRDLAGVPLGELIG